jgi:hypothetical protein
MYYNITPRRVSATNVAVGKQCVTYSECAFVALGIQHAMRMRAHCRPAVQCFYTLSHKLYDLRKKKSY